MNIFRLLNLAIDCNDPGDDLALAALASLEEYHKRLKDLLDDPNCRASRAKARELLVRNKNE